jgi:hypothetical protein
LWFINFKRHYLYHHADSIRHHRHHKHHHTVKREKKSITTSAARTNADESPMKSKHSMQSLQLATEQDAEPKVAISNRGHISGSVLVFRGVGVLGFGLDETEELIECSCYNYHQHYDHLDNGCIFYAANTAPYSRSNGLLQSLVDKCSDCGESTSRSKSSPSLPKLTHQPHPFSGAITKNLDIARTT